MAPTISMMPGKDLSYLIESHDIFKNSLLTQCPHVLSIFKMLEALHPGPQEILMRLKVVSGNIFLSSGSCKYKSDHFQRLR